MRRELATFIWLMSEASEGFEIEATNPEDKALLHFTSGTTGTPKGAVHPDLFTIESRNFYSRT